MVRGRDFHLWLCPRKTEKDMIFAVFNQLDVYNTGLESFLGLNTSFNKGVIVTSQSFREAKSVLQEHYPDSIDIVVVSLKDHGIARSIYEILGLKPRLLHAHHNRAALFSVFLSLFKSIPLVISIHSSFHHYPILTKICFLAGMYWSDWVICNSKSTKGTLPHFFQKSDKVSVIYNGVNIQKVIDAKKCNTVYGRRITICVVARLVPEKNIKFLLNAVASSSVLQEMNVKLKIIGGGPQEEDLKRYVGENEMQFIEFLGVLPRNSVYAELHKSHLFVLSSKWEGFCNAMVEALVAGLVCVVPDIKTLREVGEGASAIFYKPGCLSSFEESVSTGINQIIDNDAAISFVRNKYSLKNNCESHARLYLNVLNKACET